MLSDIVNKPCTLVQRLPGTDEDELGNEIPTEDDIRTVCEIQQIRSIEPGSVGEAAITTWQVFLLPGYSVRTGDALLVDDHGEFEFVGDGWDAVTGSDEVHHVEAEAKQTKLPEDVEAS